MSEEKIRFYHSSLNEHGHDRNKLNASDEHNCRNDPNNPNYDPALTKNNLIYIDGKKCDPLNHKENYDLIVKKKKFITDEFMKMANVNSDDEELSNTKKSKLQLARTTSKTKIKKWADDKENKLNPEEKSFWNVLYEKIGNEKLDSSKLIDELKKLGKVKKFNDKQKRLTELETFNALVGTKSKNINFHILSKELIFKIPDKYNKKVNPDDWVKIGNAIQQKYFSDFDIIYSTVHCDENPDNPHLHLSLSGKNNKSGLFNIQDYLIEKLSSHHKNYPFKGRKYSSLNKEEIIKHGEFYQDVVFANMNMYLKKLGYGFDLTKKTKKERNEENITYNDQKKSSVNREHNRQNKIRIENEEADKKLLNTKLTNKKLGEEIENRKEEISILQKTLNKLKEEADSFKRGLKYIVSYTKDDLPSDLFNFLKEFEFLNKSKSDLADDLENEAYKISNDETKNKIKEKKNSFKFR
ncbi:hypothetical protein [Vibrio aestuarianus]|uniref:Uncharacterized protein n=1 Tax=Vibrio aestuarianus TaxID=28171 RepID=A0ABD7YJZ2_9VIBR|nr:hypothetical protein [Vibrio aestuarianus]WGK85397.1 hypothetical protein PYE67_00495 [Vibrio aestuarianus]CAH8217534.1 conserved hypothetical protein [Vibrio aestuarianus]